MDPLVLGLSTFGFSENIQLRVHSRRAPNNDREDREIGSGASPAGAAMSGSVKATG